MSVPLAMTAGLATASATAAAPPSATRGLGPILASRVWLGGRPASAAFDRRVVLVDVFTFECVNCTRVVPNLKRLRARYDAQALTIVGVHAPEVPAYQASAGYVARNARVQDLTWPIVLDNTFRIWKAYEVDAWPTQLLFDRHGVLRERIVGDTQDAALDRAVAALVAESATR